MFNMKDFYKIGFGTWLFGGTTIPNPDNNDEYDIACIRNAIDAGLKHIDTAENYAELGYPIFASQCHYNLIAREPQRNNLLEYCKDNGIHFVAWRPIVARMPAWGIDSLYKKGIYPMLDQMAEKYGKTNAQINLGKSSLLSQFNLPTFSSSCRQKRHLEVFFA